MNTVHTVSATIGEKTLSFETGKLALQAQGATVLTYGDTVILAAAGMTEEPREGVDFFPMMVDFDPKYYATGKIKSSRFMKREARPPESAILTARMIDRPLRPLFPKNMRNDVQIVCTLLQANGKNTTSASGINAASMAAQLAGLPMESPVGAVRVGMKEDGSYFLDPTFEEVEKGKLDLLLAGTEDAVLMVEAGADLASNEEMLGAFEYGHAFIKKICQLQNELVAKVGVTQQKPSLADPNPSAESLVDAVLSDSDFDSVKGSKKQEIKTQMHVLEKKVLDAYADKIENEEVSKGDLLYFIDKKFGKSLKRRMFERQERIDGRAQDEIRPLYCEVGMYPRVHGSALFQRGETQSLSLATIGGPKETLIVNDPDQDETEKAYMHHYNFPAYSVGEIRPNRGPGRREIGHGALAERALRYMMPTKEENFPYTVRVVSEITTCNGSSSMASVCGSTLTLMDAGIQIKRPISGIAMGLMLNEDTGDYHILSDIMSFEDFCGDMDFKVTGDENGITALQLDIKLKGLKLSLLAEALVQAQKGRAFILESMKKAIPKPRPEMNQYAPRIESFHIDPEYIGAVIGKGGETIQGMCKDFDVTIDIEDDGLVMITSTNQENANKARSAIDSLVYEPEVGDVFEGKIKSLMDFGVFVEYLPGKEALVHISEMADARTNHPSDLVKEGDMVTVKILGTDKMGRTKLTMKGIKK